MARRAGTSPEVIDRHYAGLIDNSEAEDNKKIEKTMGWGGEDTLNVWRSSIAINAKQ